MEVLLNPWLVHRWWCNRGGNCDSLPKDVLLFHDTMIIIFKMLYTHGDVVMCDSEKINKGEMKSCDQKAELKEIIDVVDERISFSLAQRRI